MGVVSDDPRPEVDVSAADSFLRPQMSFALSLKRNKVTSYIEYLILRIFSNSKNRSGRGLSWS